MIALGIEETDLDNQRIWVEYGRLMRASKERGQAFLGFLGTPAELANLHTAALTQGGETATRLAHNQETAGSIPAPAPKP